jgi:hypothetical protein
MRINESNKSESHEFYIEILSKHEKFTPYDCHINLCSSFPYVSNPKFQISEYGLQNFLILNRSVSRQRLSNHQLC